MTGRGTLDFIVFKDFSLCGLTMLPVGFYGLLSLKKRGKKSQEFKTVCTRVNTPVLAALGGMKWVSGNEIWQHTRMSAVMVKKIHAVTPWRETQTAPAFVSVHARSWRCGHRQDGSSSSALGSLTLSPRAVGVWFHLWIVSTWQGNGSTCTRWWYQAQYGSIRFVLEQRIGVHGYPPLVLIPVRW